MRRMHWMMMALLVGGITLLPLATVRAGSDGEQTAAMDIPFDDATHRPFFNYQAYLVKHGKDGATQESWALIAAPDRAKKVADSEAQLNAIHQQLQAKLQLNNDEIELWQAVWGSANAVQYRQATHATAVVAGEKSAPVATVSAVTRRLQEIQGKDDWNLFFDGNGNSSRGPDAVTAIGSPAEEAAARRDAVADVSGHGLQVADLPRPAKEVGMAGPYSPFRLPKGEQQERRSSGAIPLTAGLVLLGGGLVLAKGLWGGEEVVSDGEALSILAQQGFGPTAPLIEKTIGGNAPRMILAATTCSDGSCSGGCAGGCQDCCSFGCSSGCGSSCGSGCGSGCQGGCSGACNGCSGTCAGEVSG